MDDAEGHFRGTGWSTEFGGGFGGVATSAVLDEWPFVYLKVFGGLPPGGSSDAASGEGALFGILFMDGIRPGPVCIGAKVEWSDSDADLGHWMLYAALGGEGDDKAAFNRTKGPINVATPAKRAKEKWPGVDRVSWFEIPLGAVSSPELLKRAVEATQQLVLGEKVQAVALIADLE